MSSGFIHVVACIRTSFFLKAKWIPFHWKLITWKFCWHTSGPGIWNVGWLLCTWPVSWAIALGWALCPFCISPLALSMSLGTSRYAENICCRNRVFWTAMRLEEHGLLTDPVLGKVNCSVRWGWTLHFPNKWSTKSVPEFYIFIDFLLNGAAQCLSLISRRRRWAMFTSNHLRFMPVF